MIYCYYKHKGSDNMNIRDEVNKTYHQTQQKLKDKEERKLIRRNKISNYISQLSISKVCKDIGDALDYWRLRRYDAKTNRIIKNIPNKMLRSARKGYYGTQVYSYYEQGLFGAYYLYPRMADYYLDRRGKHIIEYLKEEGIRYTLEANNSGCSYYSIDVYF